LNLSPHEVPCGRATAAPSRPGTGGIGGHDVTHTLDLPLGNHTPDGQISALAAQEGRVLVTKDSDFVTTFVLHGVPPKLLLISTGNISNDSLSHLFAANLAVLEDAFATHSFVELSPSAITVHS
jgi:predicted nuclease of predicted toxin-antitoxin system